ncbi:MAG: ABC transporter ATP-binding protein [Lachnospiraceae bacterium]|nr:ABC transporter ATP-binding protein [Lachnospiraceae bacterium]
MNMLEICHISKRFGDKQVLRDVDFTVPEHAVYGFVGQNGAGKTTTMKLVLGLLAADSGEILVNGEKVSFGENPVNRYIGYLPDVPEFYPYMTAAEYLNFCGAITGMDLQECKKRTEEMLALVGLAGEKHRIRGFSRGMKQRLGIAQALLNRPKLLICDEPTSALDPVGRKEILDILVSAKEQTTVLFSTHILSDVEKICEQFAFLHEGKILRQGSMEEMRKSCGQAGFEIELEREQDAAKLLRQFPEGIQRGGAYVYYEPGKGQQMEAVLAWILGEGMRIRKAEKCGLTLEALFMEVVGK